MKKQINIGIIGCGGIARAHKRGYEADEHTRISVVCDTAPNAAETFASETGADIARSVEEMIKEYKPDAVSVCSPPASHLENCRPLLNASVPVLCEKPVEMNAKRASALAKLVRTNGTLFMPAFCHRFHPPVVELKKLIDDGMLGKPLLFRNIFGGYNDISAGHRAKKDISGGGPIIDHCCHSVDLFRFLVGNPSHAQGMTGNILQELQIEDFGTFHLSIGDKIFGEITGSYSLKGCDNSIEWYGTGGCATVTYFSTDRPDLSYLVEGAEERMELDYRNKPDRFTAEIGHFLDCVRGEEHPSMTVEDGLKANQIVEAVYDSVQRESRTNIDFAAD